MLTATTTTSARLTEDEYGEEWDRLVNAMNDGKYSDVTARDYSNELRDLLREKGQLTGQFDFNPDANDYYREKAEKAYFKEIAYAKAAADEAKSRVDRAAESRLQDRLKQEAVKEKLDKAEDAISNLNPTSVVDEIKDIVDESMQAISEAYLTGIEWLNRQEVEAILHFVDDVQFTPEYADALNKTLQIIDEAKKDGLDVYEVSASAVPLLMATLKEALSANNLAALFEHIVPLLLSKLNIPNVKDITPATCLNLISDYLLSVLNKASIFEDAKQVRALNIVLGILAYAVEPDVWNAWVTGLLLAASSLRPVIDGGVSLLSLVLTGLNQLGFLTSHGGPISLHSETINGVQYLSTEVGGISLYFAANPSQSKGAPVFITVNPKMDRAVRVSIGRGLRAVNSSLSTIYKLVTKSGTVTRALTNAADPKDIIASASTPLQSTLGAAWEMVETRAQDILSKLVGSIYSWINPEQPRPSVPSPSSPSTAHLDELFNHLEVEGPRDRQDLDLNESQGSIAATKYPYQARVQTREQSTASANRLSYNYKINN